MSEDLEMKRIMALVEKEMTEPLRIWYLSYADETNFLGAIYMEAHGPISASMRAKAYKLDPGGESMFLEVPPDKIPEYKYWNRLLSKEEICEANPDTEFKTLREWEAEESDE